MHNTHPSYYYERNKMLTRVKAQYEPGPMRPRLYEVFEEAGKILSAPEYEWMYYAGMGDVGLNPATEAETATAKELLQSGYLVPTFEEDFYFTKKIRRIEHFDDVKFGIDSEKNILIYDFNGRMDLPDAIDPVIRPDSKHDAALKRIKERMDFSVSSHAVATDNAPIRLRGGPVIHPIITNADFIEIRRRQTAFTP